MPLVQRLQGLVKERKWKDADKAADEILALMKEDRVEKTKPPEAPTVQERLPAKIQKIQMELPTWVQGNPERRVKATALMKSLDEHLKAMNLEKAEQTADAILKLIGGEAPR
jgi:hypothetical protein